MIRLRMIARLAVVGAGLSGLSACAPLVAFLGIKAGTMVAQDRSLGGAVDDATINTDVNSRLARQSVTLYRKVNCKVIDGRVLLTGHVPTDADRAIAGQIASKVPGVKEVANEIEVTEDTSLSGYLNDMRISNELRAKMIADTKVAWVNYNIQTVDGSIYLMGRARDQGELERVTLHARTIAGVKRVVSYVEIQGAATRAASL